MTVRLEPSMSRVVVRAYSYAFVTAIVSRKEAFRGSDNGLCVASVTLCFQFSYSAHILVLSRFVGCEIQALVHNRQ